MFATGHFTRSRHEIYRGYETGPPLTVFVAVQNLAKEGDDRAFAVLAHVAGLRLVKNIRNLVSSSWK